MGEVYRAEDLTLGQPVALKFLPETLSADDAALARFHREVRVARQISHRNVCRVYDIGEAEGLQFLSMEYVRSEELSSVLKRFGRLPADKATEIARQLCAGLAAAHEAGVLHRDLKPSNVMIDEKGDVRVTDFGLAGLLEEFGGGAALEGTPEYMSPEQLAGRELTERSDIYSLGLVIYELFTGRKAFTASTLGELLRLRKTESMPERPSSIVRDIDPLVERVVERCLAPDPKERPASALQVANALPGGDPLPAALAAGETPSPEMVAAAPKQGSLKPAVALSVAAGALALFALCFALSGRYYLHNLVPMEKSADALRDRASEVAKKFGYEATADRVSGFNSNAQYLTYVEQHDQTPALWESLKTGHPAGLVFWYRQSPRYLAPFNGLEVTPADPPRTVSGMANLSLDMRGRLLAFEGVPRQTVQPRQPPPAPFDWSRLFAEAGLDPAAFRRVELAAHHITSLMEEVRNFMIALATCLLVSAVLWLIYVALEPYVRRRWPGRITKWTRLLAGGWHDPLVGRDLLVGALFGCAVVLVAFCRPLAASWLGLPPPRPGNVLPPGLLLRYAFNLLMSQVLNSLLFSSVLMFLLLLLTIVTRHERVAAALLWLLVASLFFGSGNFALDAVVGAAAASLLLFFGFYPMTTDFDAWYAGLTVFTAALGVALILYGLKTSLAGQPLFRGSLLNDGGA